MMLCNILLTRGGCGQFAATGTLSGDKTNVSTLTAGNKSGSKLFWLGCRINSIFMKNESRIRFVQAIFHYNSWCDDRLRTGTVNSRVFYDEASGGARRYSDTVSWDTTGTGEGTREVWQVINRTKGVSHYGFEIWGTDKNFHTTQGRLEHLYIYHY